MNVLVHRHTLKRHWQEDPASFILRLWRRNATNSHRRVLTAVDTLLGAAPGTRMAATAALLRENPDSVRERLKAALAKGPRGTQAKYFADLALVAHEPELAKVFAERMDDAIGTEQTLAKLDFYNGNTTQAISRLDPGNSRLARLRERYLAEQEVFGDWVPVVPTVDAYEPRAQTVLHLLTNSLPYTTTGYTQRSHSLLKAQAAAGWHVHAATRLGYPESLGILPHHSKQTLEHVTYHRLRSDGPIPNIRDRLQEETEKLLKLVLDLRPTALHTTTHFVNGLVARAVAEAVGIPWVYEVRGQLSDTWASKRGPEATESERYRHFNAREAEVMAAADLVLTLGHAMRNKIVAAGVDPARVLLSPNAVGTAYLETPKPSRAAKTALHLDPDKFYIGTVSSLVAYEGLDDLISAYAELRRERDDVELMIVGDGIAMPSLRLHAAELGLDPEEIFTGRVPAHQAPLRHQALDVFVVPRKDFAVTRSVTPLKPVEAMASCRPVVASDLPALREMVSEGVTGSLVPPGNPSALAAAIDRLLEDGEARSRMGFAGRSMVLRSRTWERNARMCIEKYMELGKFAHD